MKYRFSFLFCLLILCNNLFARTLFLVSHENRPKEALLLKEKLISQFFIPDDFVEVLSQTTCIAKKQAILHVCITKNSEQEYKILNLNKKIINDSFKELRIGKEND